MISNDFIADSLLSVLAELKAQPEVATSFDPAQLSYSEQISQLEEWLNYANESGIAYESIVCLLEEYPFKLSGAAAIKLLEVGLFFGYKTDRQQPA